MMYIQKTMQACQAAQWHSYQSFALTACSYCWSKLSCAEGGALAQLDICISNANANAKGIPNMNITPIKLSMKSLMPSRMRTIMHVTATEMKIETMGTLTSISLLSIVNICHFNCRVIPCYNDHAIVIMHNTFY